MIRSVSIVALAELSQCTAGVLFDLGMISTKERVALEMSILGRHVLTAAREILESETEVSEPAKLAEVPLANRTDPDKRPLPFPTSIVPGLPGQ